MSEPTKEHRWVIDFRHACRVIQNEDKKFHFTYDDIPDDECPTVIWCYDCEENIIRVFGQPCYGEKDERVSDALWEGI